MALFTPSASPAVTVKEIDLTGSVPNVQSATGAFVGNFGWGPVGEVKLVSDENGLVSRFSAPTDDNAVDFHSASYFLRYSNALYVVREQDSDARNSLASHSDVTLTNQKLNNLDAFESATIDATDGVFLAKYPGVIGNSLKVSIVGSHNDSSGATNFNAWTYKGKFDAAPGTSDFVSKLGGKNDEIHVVVIDEDGLISGVKGEVLETFPFLSVARNAKNPDGSTNYYREVLKNKSQWIYAGVGHVGSSAALSDFAGANWGTNATTGAEDFKSDYDWAIAQSEWSFTGGVTSASLGTDDVLRGFDKFEDVDSIELDFLIAPDSLADATATTIVNDLISTAEARKDCVAVASPSRNAVVTVGTNASVLACNNTYTKSTYFVQDNNFLKVYDKYNDKYIKIPAASSTAGLMAATDLTAAPWFSPAGARRGRYLGITDIVLSPTKTERDALYKVGINPIANIPGEGVILFGDKTNSARPTAFDRINVRRLFLTLERTITIAGRATMFEFNDEFTRAEFVNVVEPLLREVKGRRGITDFKVLCDATNNTPAVVDANRFVASIFIKPAHSINFVTLNFVAVRTGVEFEEVVGTV